MKAVRTLYLVVASTLLLFVAVNAMAWLALLGWDAVRDARMYGRLPEVVKKNYAQFSREETVDLLRAWNAVRFRFLSGPGFREAEIHSRHLNIDADGFRSSGGPARGLAALEGATWFFGGSTALGWGVADHAPIPAQLEAKLGRPVVNLGAAMYNSELENLLLLRYLRAGFRPAKALFLDGINERCESAGFEPELTEFFDSARHPYTPAPTDLARPVRMLVDRFWKRTRGFFGAGAEPATDELACTRDGRRIPLAALQARYLAERQAICGLYGIECLTLVQPFAGLHGRHEDPALDDTERAQLRRNFEHLAPGWRQAGARFVTGALDGLDRHAYIDVYHYSAAASERIAAAIADLLR